MIIAYTAQNYSVYCLSCRSPKWSGKQPHISKCAFDFYRPHDFVIVIMAYMYLEVHHVCY